jgi:predicted HicB family RNase H-like nuclease
VQGVHVLGLGIVKETINIRVLKDSHRRLKVRAAREGKTIMTLVDDLSKVSSKIQSV